MNYENAQKEFINTITKLDYKYRKWEIFTDFCRMGAIALYQPFRQSEELEKEYLTIINKYDKETINIFPKLLSLVVEGLSSKFGDFLGESFMMLDLGSKYKGQFFTPYNISKFMSMILSNDIKEKESLSEPACGAGGMIIARAETIQEKGFNYQQIMEVQAVDIDSLCFSMTYIQLTLLHIKAEVIHGNSLSLEVFDTWYTPAYFMGAMTKRDKREKNIILPCDNIDNKIINTKEEIFIYTDEQIATFESGRLF